MAAAGQAKQSDAKQSDASISTMLATDRTRLAHDRTLMAWVRTATSLISFGFTIYKFFQYMQDKGQASQHLFDARHFAGLMIIIGIVALILATIQNRRDMVHLRKAHPEVPYSMATVLGALIGLLGLIALVAVIFQI